MMDLSNKSIHYLVLINWRDISNINYDLLLNYYYIE